MPGGIDPLDPAVRRTMIVAGFESPHSGMRATDSAGSTGRVVRRSGPPASLSLVGMPASHTGSRRPRECHVIQLNPTRLAISIIGVIVFTYGVGVLTTPLVLAMETHLWSEKARTLWLVTAWSAMGIGSTCVVAASAAFRRSEGRAVRCPKCRHSVEPTLTRCPECAFELGVDPLRHFSAHAISGAMVDGTCRECGRVVRPERVMKDLVPGQTVACPRCRMGLGHG